MNLSDEQLLKVEEMAAALLPPADIAILIGVEFEQLDLFRQVCTTWIHSPIYERYQRGRIGTKYELHQKVVKLAKAGSPQAEALANDYLKSQNS